MKKTKQTLLVGLISTFAAVSTGCGGDEAAPADTRNPYYVAAERAFRGCTFGECHAAGGVGDLASRMPLGEAIAAGDFRAALVNVPACEYGVMDRVEPGDPDNSWIMVKLTANYVMSGAEEGRLIFTPDPSWSEADKCNQAIPGFGNRMPDTAPFMLAAGPLNDIRTWIQMGAPGPNDPVSDAGM